METTMMGYLGIIGNTLGLYRDEGKQNGSYYITTKCIYWGYSRG